MQSFLMKCLVSDCEKNGWLRGFSQLDWNHELREPVQQQHTGVQHVIRKSPKNRLNYLTQMKPPSYCQVTAWLKETDVTDSHSTAPNHVLKVADCKDCVRPQGRGIIKEDSEELEIDLNNQVLLSHKYSSCNFPSSFDLRIVKPLDFQNVSTPGSLARVSI